MRPSLLRSVAIALVTATVSGTSAVAGDLFTVTVTSNGVTDTAGFNSAVQAIDELKNGQLNALIPTYNSTSIASGQINYRGLQVEASYPTNGTTLVFQVPSIGLNQSFTGTTRDESQQLLVDYLKKNNEYGAIMHALAAVSPSDPVAGNPTSLQANIVADGFNSAFATSPAVSPTPKTSQPAVNTVQVGLEYGHFTNSSTNVDAYTIPLSYSFNVGPEDNYRLSIDLPITYINTQGAQSGAASLGIGLTIPISDNWSLTPRISGGATGSIDLASVAAMTAGSVTSAYKFVYDGYGFIVGNMFGYSHSIDLKFGTYSFDPKIGDAFTKNGVMIDIPTGRWGIDVPFLPGADMQVFATDTRFWGTKLYENSFQELGFNIGSSEVTFISHDIRLGATYIHGQHSNGATANIGFTF